MKRQLRLMLSRQVVILGSGLAALSVILTGLGVWLDQQFTISHGPLRQGDPKLVVWVSLVAVGLVVVLWTLGWLLSDRESDERLE